MVRYRIHFVFACLVDSTRFQTKLLRRRDACSTRSCDDDTNASETELQRLRLRVAAATGSTGLVITSSCCDPFA